MQIRIGYALVPAALAALALAAPAGASTVRGTVVHKSSSRHSFVVAQRGGRLAVVAGRRAPRIGRVVIVSGRSLRRGVLAARRLRARGLRRHARLRGTVTWRGRRAFTVSSAGASILVRDGSGADPAPPVGEDVTVDVNIGDHGDLERGDVQEHGDDGDGIEVSGHVLAVDTAARTLTLSADDSEEGDGSVTVAVPATFELGQFSAGQDVELRVTKADDGTLTLVRVLHVAAGDGEHGDDPGEHGGGDHPGQGGGDEPGHGSGPPAGGGEPGHGSEPPAGGGDEPGHGTGDHPPAGGDGGPGH